jgi:hypothetical protein
MSKNFTFEAVCCNSGSLAKKLTESSFNRTEVDEIEHFFSDVEKRVYSHSNQVGLELTEEDLHKISLIMTFVSNARERNALHA